MSRKPVDLAMLTMEEIFRAKEERRKRLAKLPFEEKIRIVKRLQTVSELIKGEKTIFSSFLRACPDFAGEPIKEWDKVEEWYAKRSLTPPAHPYDKRPDIIARTTTGRMIGIELKSWVNREQSAQARRKERTQDHIPNAIGQDTMNPMRETLTGALLAYRDDDRYQDLARQVGLDESYLLVHYDLRSFAYNAPSFGFEEVADFARQVLDGNGGHFDRIFLFNFLFGKQEAQQIFPDS